MKLAFYTGGHQEDNFLTRMVGSLTRMVQKGPYGQFTHVEAIHAEHDDGTTTIASASMHDGGVRSVRTILNPAHWCIVDTPCWDVNDSIELLSRTCGAKYDIRGAIATAFIGHHETDRWFCSEWVGEPYLKASANFGPHQLAAIALSFGDDVTSRFFQRQVCQRITARGY